VTLKGILLSEINHSQKQTLYYSTYMGYLKWKCIEIERIMLVAMSYRRGEMESF
jgi:ribosomal protein L20